MPKIKFTKKELSLIADRMGVEMDWGDKSVDPEYGIYPHKQWVRMQSIRNKCINALNIAALNLDKPEHDVFVVHHVHSKTNKEE